jgi:hypothetical protein
VTEWKLFDDEPPEPPAALAGRGWMNLRCQPGFARRAAMVAGLAALAAALQPGITAVTELGCGDGSLLALLPPHLQRWGYEIGAGDVRVARERGLDVRQADILAGGLEYGGLLVVSEVLEHLAGPQAFLEALPPRLLIASSPSAETGAWHNPVHAWAWDAGGYADLLGRSGWRVLYQAECDGGPNTFGGVTGLQRFQAIVAVRS